MMEMEQQIDTHGETLVCPLIAWNCFPQEDPVRIWYTMLGGRNHANMTKEAGCWLNFQIKMRETWSKSIAVTQREAEDRSKQNDETFLIYYFQKLRLLTAAFPESHEATHISRIRAKFNDAQADRYIREKHNLKAFASEIRLYDDHLKLHPSMTKPSIRMPQNSYSSFIQRTAATAPTNATQHSTAGSSQQPRRLAITLGTNDVAVQRAENYKKRNLLRIQS